MARNRKSATSAERKTSSAASTCGSEPENQAPDELAAIITREGEKKARRQEFERRIVPYRSEYHADCEALRAALTAIYDNQIATKHCEGYDLKLWGRHITAVGELVRKYSTWRRILNDYNGADYMLLRAAADGMAEDVILARLHGMRDAGMLGALTWQYALNALPGEAYLVRDIQEQRDLPEVCQLIHDPPAPPSQVPPVEHHDAPEPVSTRPRVPGGPSQFRQDEIIAAIRKAATPLTRSELVVAMGMPTEGRLGADLAWMVRYKVLIKITGQFGYWPSSDPLPV